MTQFKYTCETPNKFVGGDVHSNDYETIEDYAIECGQEYGYSIVRDNVNGEIIFEFGDSLFEQIEQGII